MSFIEIGDFLVVIELVIIVKFWFLWEGEILWVVFLGMYISDWEEGIIILLLVDVFFVEKLWRVFKYGFDGGENDIFVIIEVF